MKKIETKYHGKCRICGEDVALGQSVWFDAKYGVFHPGCLTYDLTGIPVVPAFVMPKGYRGSDKRWYGDRMQAVAEAKLAEAGPTEGDLGFMEQGVKSYGVAPRGSVERLEQEIAQMREELKAKPPIGFSPPPTVTPNVVPGGCEHCGKAHPGQRHCVRCKKLMYPPAGHPAHCNACWMDNPTLYGAPTGTQGPTAAAQAVQNNADASLAAATAAISTVHLYGGAHLTACGEDVSPSMRTTEEMPEVTCTACRTPGEPEEKQEEEKKDRFQLLDLD